MNPAKKSDPTGGPWQQKSDFDREGLLTIIGNVDGEYVDGVPQCTYTTICEVDDNEDALDNARLIAAAPELLEALDSIRIYANDTLSGRIGEPADAQWYAEAVLEIRNRARAAIAKTIGIAAADINKIGMHT